MDVEDFLEFSRNVTCRVFNPQVPLQLFRPFYTFYTFICFLHVNQGVVEIVVDVEGFLEFSRNVTCRVLNSQVPLQLFVHHLGHSTLSTQCLHFSLLFTR